MDITIPLRLLIEHIEDDRLLLRPLFFEPLTTMAENEKKARSQIEFLIAEDVTKGEAGHLFQKTRGFNFRTDFRTFRFKPPHNYAWHSEPFSLRFPVVFFEIEQAGARFLVGMVPTLGISVVAKKEEELEERLERESVNICKRRDVFESPENLLEIQAVRAQSFIEEEFTLSIEGLKEKLRPQKKEKPSILNQIGDRLTPHRKKKVFERDDIVEKISRCLTTEPIKSVLLVGKPGVGKTAIITETARRNTIPKTKHTFYETDGARLIAGQTGFGMWQERLGDLINEVRKKPVIMVLGDLMTLNEVGRAEGQEQSIAGYLQPYFANGTLPTIAEITPERLTLLERENPRLIASFQKIEVDESDRETTLQIMNAVAAQEKIEIQAEAVELIYDLHERYSGYSARPGRVLHFLRNLNTQYDCLTSQTVMAAFSEETGLPLFLLDPQEPMPLEETRAFFTSQVIGQDQACREVVDMLAAIKAGLTKTGRPIAGFMFIGPTGVGKTQTARTLAQFLFGSADRLSRFDMSEFADPSAVERLIHADRSGEGLLTSVVRGQPFSVLLFDEMEKADPLFYDFLLQILGDGRLTDRKGNTAYFQNCVIIMTSNLGAESFKKNIRGLKEDRKQTSKRHFQKELLRFLRPEIYNRIDRIIPFQSLDRDDIRKITELEIDKLKRREGIAFANYQLNLGNDVLDYISEHGYDGQFGARGLQRFLFKSLLVPISEVAANLDNANRYQFQVIMENGRPTVKSQITAAKETPAIYQKEGKHIQATNLRRQVAKVEQCMLFSELENEIYKLERLHNRDKKEQKFARKPARLLELEKLHDRIEALASEVNLIEEQALLELYHGQEKSSPDIEQTAITQKLDAVCEELFLFSKHPHNEAVVCLFGDTTMVYLLAEIYLAYCRRKKWKVAAIAYFANPMKQRFALENVDPGSKTYSEEESWRQNIGDRRLGRADWGSLEDYKLPEDKDLIGLALTITGHAVNPTFAMEEGRHRMIKTRELNVLVSLSDEPALDYYPQEKVEFSPTFAGKTIRREYHFDKKFFKDPVAAVERKFTQKNLEPQIHELMNAALEKAIKEVIKE